MRFCVVACVLVAAALPAHADDTTTIESPPPPKTPFDQGKFGLALGGGTQAAFGSTYFVIGGGLEYFVLDGVGVGLSALHEFGSGPSISKVSPAVRYVAQPLVGKWPVVPYVGAFYNHWFIGDPYPDIDALGGRAGMLFVSGQVVLGLGVAVEHQLRCTMDCNLVYPDITISLAL